LRWGLAIKNAGVNKMKAPTTNHRVGYLKVDIKTTPSFMAK